MANSINVRCPRCLGDIEKIEIEGEHVIIVDLKCKRCKWRHRIKIKRTEKFDWVSEIAKMRMAEERRKEKHI